MSVVSPKAKPTACDACRRLELKCSLNNYVDDCERCTNLRTRCFITDDYNITIRKVPQRALQKFKSAEFLEQIVNLRRELEDSESNGENTYAVIEAVVSNFKGISEEAINYPEVRGFFVFNFSSLINWIKIYSDHQVWNVARYDQKTLQSLTKLGAIMNSIHYSPISASVNWFVWQVNIIESERLSPSDSLPDNHSQTHTSSSEPVNEPECMLSADIQAGELQAEDPQVREL
ncbi:hypothetical protein BOTCAL_0025g00030 [Botryotinia calthae]|uniref:Zn(2)-C6 fungal-type domain-containing protein n=1 Tax=Botryotinia calthae TaxID=38488 RepID=A0A4Y8DGS8_9HELO|nr:hypothetical protein BOTCAL_0025g00030 [Botryotinia calthae]